MFSRDTDLAEIQIPAWKNKKVGYPTYPIPLTPHLSQSIVGVLYLGLGRCGAAAEGRHAFCVLVPFASSNFGAILSRFHAVSW